ncbi:MAG: hypothetical protein JW932_03620 [Deltaproteobacteria bacterium]|nr:hypothetical protein [Deltaproteobacteria bacterium]
MNYPVWGQILLEQKKGYKEVRISSSKDITIKGIIYPSSFDEDNHVIGIVVDTDEQDSYFVDNNKNGKALIDFLHCRVEANGSIRENEDGEYIINIREYKILGNMDDQKKVHE